MSFVIDVSFCTRLSAGRTWWSLRPSSRCSAGSQTSETCRGLLPSALSHSASLALCFRRSSWFSTSPGCSESTAAWKTTRASFGLIINLTSVDQRIHEKRVAGKLTVGFVGYRAVLGLFAWLKLRMLVLSLYLFLRSQLQKAQRKLFRPLVAIILVGFLLELVYFLHRNLSTNKSSFAKPNLSRCWPRSNARLFRRWSPIGHFKRISWNTDAAEHFSSWCGSCNQSKAFSSANRFPQTGANFQAFYIGRWGNGFRNCCC